MKLTSIFRTKTIQLNTNHDDFWLYDEIQGMNLVVRAKTERDAFVEAIEWYQKRLENTEEKLKTLTDKVASFVQVLHDDCEITPEIETEDFN